MKPLKSMAAVLAAVIALLSGPLVESVPASAGADEDKPSSSIKWHERPTIFGGSGFSIVNIDADSIEQAHEGMEIPKLRDNSGKPIYGAPYYFFGQDAESGQYLSDYVLMCIDILHVRYEVPPGSFQFDLATQVPAATAVDIMHTLNAGMQLAIDRGLIVNVDGSVPLKVESDEAAEVLLATQIKAWHLFARDLTAMPLPYLTLDNFSARREVTSADGTKETIESWDLSGAYREIDELVDRYRHVPAFASDPVDLVQPVTLSDAVALDDFEVVIDHERSTPDFERFVSVEIGDDGIFLSPKSDHIDPVDISFIRNFKHNIGGSQHEQFAIRAHNDQSKAIITNAYQSEFAVQVNSRLSAAEGLPPVVNPEEPATLRDLTLVKKDQDTNEPLAGAVFDLYREVEGANRLIRSGLTTGDDGMLVAGGLRSGKYELVETSLPSGYTYVDDKDSVSVTLKSGSTANIEVDFFNRKDEGAVTPGAVELSKVDEANAPLEGAEFTIYDALDTIQDSAVTDAAGYALFPALTPGVYTVKETRAPEGFVVSPEALEGYPVTVVSAEVARVRGSGENEAVVNSSMAVETEPSLETVATNKDSGGKLLPGGGGVVSDLVSYTNLVPGTSYTLRGELMDKRTSESTGIRASKKFTPRSAGGQESLDFAVDGTHANKQLVVFERLFISGEDRSPVAAHEDINSAEQTVTVDAAVSLKTTATSKADGSKYIPYVGGTVTDTVSFTGLIEGRQYSLVGQLMDKETGELVTDSKESIMFTPTAADGEQSLDLTVPKGFANRSIVVYEYLYEADGRLLAEHTDLGDVGQTVTVNADPTIGTTATNKDDGTHILPHDGGVIVDEVRYTGLIPGVTYTIRGELMDKTSGQPTGMRSPDLQFVPSSAIGTVSVDFTVGNSFAGQTLVAYERLYEGSTLVAQHTDIDSAEQAVAVNASPSLATTATNKDTGDKTSLRFFGGSVVDEVRYTGLIKGELYTITGELMKKKSSGTTGDSDAIPTGITSEITFRPDSPDGSVRLDFVVNDEHPNAVLVAFEELFDAQGSRIAEHADIESTEQTITVGEVPTLVTNAKNKHDVERPLEFQGGTVIDVVDYTNLKAGSEYTLKGELMDKATGGTTGITAERTFVAEKVNGSTELDFVVPFGYAGKALVVFETLIENERVIATHRDIDSQEQTVDVRTEPRVTTSAADEADGDKDLTGSDGTVVDTVFYTGLIPGREYTLQGELRYKSGGAWTGVSAERTFVPTSTDGAVDLKLPVPDWYKDAWVVVFETVLDGEVMVAEHKDLDSEAQSIHVERTPGLLATTGSSSTWSASMIGAMLLALGTTLLAAIRIHNQRKQEQRTEILRF